MIGCDAIAIGDHEFDSGSQVPAGFLTAVLPSPAPLPSATLDLASEPGLKLLSRFGRIAVSTVIDAEGPPMGLVSATTPEPALISNPGERGIEAVVPAVRTEIDALRQQGVS